MEAKNCPDAEGYEVTQGMLLAEGVDNLAYVGTPYTIELQTGEEEGNLIIQLCAKHTLINRAKYWLFCQFFPFKHRWLPKEDRVNAPTPSAHRK